MTEILTLVVGLLGGFMVGAAAIYFYLNKTNDHVLARKQAENVERCNTLLANAETRAKEIEVLARQDAIELREEVDAEVDQERKKLDEIEARLTKREDTLDLKLETLAVKERKLDDKEHKLEARSQQIQALELELDARSKKLGRVEERQHAELMRISGLNEEHARQMLFERLEKQYAAEAGDLVRRAVEKAEDEAKGRSRDILLNAIQRYASAQTAEHTVSTVEITDDAMKGRVIGKEGRNIRTFEKRTGVDVIIDDTPGIVVVSCFDPVRREVARESMQRLVADGRIQPGRIEEVVDEVEKEMEENLVELGSKAAAEAHVPNIPRPILPMLGRLHYRTSYGQNVLKHSIEVAYIAQMMADQLGLDGTIARRAGLLHDLGKALDHEIEGGHPQIGHDVLKRHGEAEEVLNAALGHHGDVPATTPYTPLVMAADAVSASRPGARRESLDRYIARLTELEDVCMKFDGVRQAYAIHAGREVRVIVDARKVDDRTMAKLARDMAKQVEEELRYPGEVKLTVLREVRTTEYAR